MSPDRKFPAEMAIAVFLALLGIYILFSSRSFSALGSLFPRIIGVLLLILSLSLVGSLLNKLRKARAVLSESVHDPASPPKEVMLWRSFASVAIMGLWVGLVPIGGFITTSLLSFLAIAFLVPREAPWTPRSAAGMAVSGLVTVSAIYLLLTKLLLVPLPSGYLF
ncbi:MAG: tripartite tricarboxylate transporter TctB family protein [Thermomicrobiales bacterium]